MSIRKLTTKPTTAQSLGALIKSARDIMRKDKGLNGDLDRLPMLTWIMFLKFLDDLELQRETEAELARRKFQRAIDPPYRWRDWAANPAGITGDELMAFVNNEEAVLPDQTRGPGLFAYLRSLTGREGGVGLGLVLGGDTTLTQAMVQSAGTALRWKSSALRREMKRGGVVQRMLLRYIQAVWTQTAQSALCNRHHTLEQQLCRWLLLSLDRIDGNVLRMTQQLIANMLGVRRERLALVAKRMQADGWISYRHGVIVVRDRAKLEARVCECYEVVKAEYRRLIEYPRTCVMPKARRRRLE